MPDVKIYTKTGDTGKTTLFGNDNKYSKSDSVFDLMGGIDEVNAGLGLLTYQVRALKQYWNKHTIYLLGLIIFCGFASCCISHIYTGKIDPSYLTPIVLMWFASIFVFEYSSCQSKKFTKIEDVLLMIQEKNVNLLSHISNPDRVRFIGGAEIVKIMEEEIDTITAILPKLTNFILVYKSKESAWCNVTRTIVRRVERELSRYCLEHKSLNTECLPYMNRMSDYLFTVARCIDNDQWSPPTNYYHAVSGRNGKSVKKNK